VLIVSPSFLVNSCYFRHTFQASDAMSHLLCSFASDDPEHILFDKRLLSAGLNYRKSVLVCQGNLGHKMIQPLRSIVDDYGMKSCCPSMKPHI
jgi:hypothetical protein